MSKRATRAQTAQETLRILEQGWYNSPTGRRVDLRDALEAARSGSVLYTPADFGRVFSHSHALLAGRSGRGRMAIEVVNETTLHAARRLVQDSAARVLALNFASARNPGGGFLKGSQAQEESLARASGLYPCLTARMEMYETNRRCPTCLYTDHMIYSPDVPVFRDGDDSLLEESYSVSFVTAPAVNVGALRTNEPDRLGHVEPVMRARMEKVLSLAVLHRHEMVVLGAWGCGVFGNDPRRVADWFACLLTREGRFDGAFTRVVFAVLDRQDGETIRAFEHLACEPGELGNAHGM